MALRALVVTALLVGGLEAGTLGGVAAGTESTVVTGIAGLLGAATDQAGRLAGKGLVKDILLLAEELTSEPLDKRLVPLLWPMGVLVVVLIQPVLAEITGGVVSPLLAAADVLLPSSDVAAATADAEPGSVVILLGNKVGEAALDSLSMSASSGLPATAVGAFLNTEPVCVGCAANPAADVHLTKPLAGDVKSCRGGVPGESPMSPPLPGLVLLRELRRREGSFA